jgi:hypothetical protein
VPVVLVGGTPLHTTVRAHHPHQRRGNVSWKRRVESCVSSFHGGAESTALLSEPGGERSSSSLPRTGRPLPGGSSCALLACAECDTCGEVVRDEEAACTCTRNSAHRERS